jgi:hypothetical protein
MNLGKILIVAGLFLVILGLFYIYGPKIPLLGRLPGDIIIHRENTTFSFPLASSLVVSLILTIIVNVVVRIFHK